MSGTGRLARMRVRHYSYFAFRSETVPAAAITARLRTEPDKFQVRGSRTDVPPRPVCHAWEVTCDQPGLRVDEQLAAIYRRLSPHLDALAALATELRRTNRGSVALVVVRHFDTSDGEEENDGITHVDGRRLERLPGQHQLLGWVLHPDVINLLHRTGAALDVDEYG